MQDEESPERMDADIAERVLDAIISRDFMPAGGSTAIDGDRAKWRIRRALEAARLDERRRGFHTPMPMRATRQAEGAPAVMSRWPKCRPLHHVIVVDGEHFRSYVIHIHRVPLISDDGRIVVERHGTLVTAEVDGELLVSCGLREIFPDELAAAHAGIAKRRQKDAPEPTADQLGRMR